MLFYFGLMHLKWHHTKAFCTPVNGIILLIEGKYFNQLIKQTVTIWITINGHAERTIRTVLLPVINNTIQLIKNNL